MLLNGLWKFIFVQKIVEDIVQGWVKLLVQEERIECCVVCTARRRVSVAECCGCDGGNCLYRPRDVAGGTSQ